MNSASVFDVLMATSVRAGAAPAGSATAGEQQTTANYIPASAFAVTSPERKGRVSR